MNDYIKNFSTQEIEKVTGESHKTIMQWRKGTKKVPESAIRLLKLVVEGKVLGFGTCPRSGHTFAADDAATLVLPWCKLQLLRGVSAGFCPSMFGCKFAGF